MIRFTILFLVLLSFTEIALAAPLRIAATTGMIADVAREVGGDRVHVSQIIGSGVDPHLYRLTRSDLAILNDAQVVFANGLILEGRMEEALTGIAKFGKIVKAVTEELPKEALYQGLHGAPDPHVWMDPVLWTEACKLIAKTLAVADPEGRAFFEANSVKYQEKLAALVEYAKRISATIPSTSRVLVTAHDAFHYFGNRFQFEVFGIQGISTESETGIQDIEKLVSLLVSRKIPAVFIESTISEKSVRSLIDGAAAQGQTVKVGGQLFSDAFGKDGTYEGTYIGMIDHNVTTIVRALGGNAPEKGMNGLLQGEGH